MCKNTKVDARKPYGYLYKNEQNHFVYSCSSCTDEFESGSELEGHTIVHDIKIESNEVPLESRYNLRPLSISIEKLQTIEIDDSPPATELVKIECDSFVSDPFFGGEYNFDENVSTSSTDHLEPPPPPPPPKRKKSPSTEKVEKIKSFECDVCKRKFTAYGFLKRHLLSGHKKRDDWFQINLRRKKKEPTPCNICGKRLVALRYHMRTFHSDDRPFKCNVCGVSYKYKSNLESHARLHTGDRPFMCNECGRAFKRNSEMHAHINLVHKKVRKHKCDRIGCSKSYVNAQQLTDHINVQHLNLKTYQCETCNRSLGTRKQYRQHLRDHLEKKFQCRFCDSKFPTELGQKLHEFGSHSTDTATITV